jgi:putative molybdopterin biosynthesis protein
MAEFMTTAEVADYLRLKERKVYELVRLRRIPCSHVTGKLLFPKRLIDLWVASHIEFDGSQRRAPPPIAAGSHDLLLEWALRESRCDLALLTGGSEDGLRRLAQGDALVAGLHIIDPDTGDYNIAAVRRLHALADLVLIEWARRRQGLVLAAGNPKQVRTLADIRDKRLRVAHRQEGAGAEILFRFLLSRDGLSLDELNLVAAPALTETDLAAAVLDGGADCGLAIEAVARRFRLDFLPLHQERFDLAMHRPDYFGPAMQRLLGFARTAGFAATAEALGGYDVSRLGQVVFNS